MFYLIFCTPKYFIDMYENVKYTVMVSSNAIAAEKIPFLIDLIFGFILL